jgi:hypothetical protein
VSSIPDSPVRIPVTPFVQLTIAACAQGFFGVGQGPHEDIEATPQDTSTAAAAPQDTAMRTEGAPGAPQDTYARGNESAPFGAPTQPVGYSEAGYSSANRRRLEELTTAEGLGIAGAGAPVAALGSPGGRGVGGYEGALLSFVLDVSSKAFSSATLGRQPLPTVQLIHTSRTLC